MNWTKNLKATQARRRKELLESKELYNTKLSKYTTFFKREAAKTSGSSIFQATNSLQTVRKYCNKYKDTDEWGKKYDKKEEMHTDLHDAFKNIFDERPRDKNATIENFPRRSKIIQRH